MHGRLKVKTDSQKELEKRLEKEEKCKQFKAGENMAFLMRAEEQRDSESLAITGQLVSVNPDFYTLWNFRREIILWIKTESETNGNVDEFEKICKNELQLTENCLRVNPKSYCVWHQRSWIISNMSFPDFHKEIALCNQCLQLDERNFICWDYRRFVSKLGKISIEEELEFTLLKIKDNFSNFSSWYYRSCLFTSAANNQSYDFAQQWKREYDLVENAIFTDPSDQSAWFYHKWLVSTNYGNDMKPSTQLNYENSVKMTRIVVNKSQSQLIASFSRPLKYRPLITLTINDKFLADIEWKALEEFNSSVWFTDLDPLLVKDFNGLTVNPIPTFVRNPESIEPIEVKVNETDDKQVFVWEQRSDQLVKRLALEECYLKSLRELHEMETNNKWVNLTLAWSDPNTTQFDSLLEALIRLDPLRTNYYNDLKSKTLMKEKIQNFQSFDLVLLKNLKITALYESNRLSHISALDLSDNNLLKLSKTFNHLLSLEVLVLDSNKIYTIDRDLKFNKLKLLSINNNKIFKFESLTNLGNCLNLEKVVIKGNPISSSLKDVPNSQLLLSDGLKIISCDSDINDSDVINNYCEQKVCYNLL